MNEHYINMPMAPCVEDAVKEWEYQQSRIRLCKKIIAESPNTPKARNAQLLIDDIKMQMDIA